MAYQVIPIRFVPVGSGNAVCANSVIAMLSPDSAPSRRRLAKARDTWQYVDMTGGHAVRSLLLMGEGQVVGCSVSPKTMLARLNTSVDQDEIDPE